MNAAVTALARYKEAPMAKKKAKKAAKKTAKKAVKKAARKVARKPAKKPVKKAVKKSAKRAAPRPAAPRAAAPKMSAMAAAPAPAAIPVSTPAPVASTPAMPLPATEPPAMHDDDEHPDEDEGGDDDAGLDFGDDESDDPDIGRRRRVSEQTAPIAGAATKGGVRVGMRAPDFKLPDAGGASHSLADYRGRRVVLYFYPKDDTPGCTTEACRIRDAYGGFDAVDADVLGVSPDSPASHASFAAKFSLPFALLADEDHRTCEAYGVWKEKERDGAKYWGVARTTFVIDENGVIARVFENVKPDGHANELIEFLRAHAPGGAQLTLPY